MAKSTTEAATPTTAQAASPQPARIPYAAVQRLLIQREVLAKRAAKTQRVQGAEAQLYVSAVAESSELGYVYHQTGFATQALDKDKDGNPTPEAITAASRSVDGQPHYDLYLMPVLKAGENAAAFLARCEQIRAAGYEAELTEDGQEVKAIAAPVLPLPTQEEADSVLRAAFLDLLKNAATKQTNKNWAKPAEASEKKAPVSKTALPTGKLNI